MARGGPPEYGRRDCRFDHFVTAAINQGYGKELVLSGIETAERAHEIRRGIYRCAKHRGVSADAGKSTPAAPGEMGVTQQGKTWTLRWRIWDKRSARKRHLERHGSDRSQWPYDPRRPWSAEERERFSNRNEQGGIVRHD